MASRRISHCLTEPLMVVSMAYENSGICLKIRKTREVKALSELIGMIIPEECIRGTYDRDTRKCQQGSKW